MTNRKPTEITKPLSYADIEIRKTAIVAWKYLISENKKSQVVK